MAAQSFHRSTEAASTVTVLPCWAVVAISCFVLPGDEVLGAMMSNFRVIQLRCSPELKIDKMKFLFANGVNWVKIME